MVTAHKPFTQADLQKPLRFCMITTFYPPYNFGGDGIFVQRLANELAERGHQVDVIHCQDAYNFLADERPVADYNDHPNVTVHGLKSGLGFLSPLVTQQTGHPILKARRIRQILSKGFDVINYHNISLVGGPGILSYGTGIKLYTLHEYWLICPTHVLFKFNRAVCTSPRCFTCNLIHKRPPPWWRYTNLVKKTVQHVDAFISPDRFTMHTHRQFGLDLPMVHLPHFIPAPDEADSSGGEDPDLETSPYFLFVGRLERIKGLQTLMPIFLRYRRARLLIAGTGTYERTLKKMARGDPNIVFLGFQSGRRLNALYRRAVAVLVPSINYEVAPPLVIMEGFKHRTPAIVRNLGSMPEIIEDSEGGMVYDSDETLIDAMNRLIDTPAYRHTLGTNGHRACEINWSVDDYLNKYLKLIYTIAEKGTENRIELSAPWQQS